MGRIELCSRFQSVRRHSRIMDDNNGVTSDDPRDTEIFIAGMSYWTSHADLDTFNSATLVRGTSTFFLDQNPSF